MTPLDVRRSTRTCGFDSSAHAMLGEPCHSITFPWLNNYGYSTCPAKRISSDALPVGARLGNMNIVQ